MPGSPASPPDMLQGTLDVLILQTLVAGPAHGHTIAHVIGHRSEDVLQVEHGSLYPALHRLEDRGWIASFWGTSENNRKARYYRLTPAGRRQLDTETSRWDRLCARSTRCCARPRTDAMRLPRWLARARWDRERARELESYLEIETADNIARGLSPDDARDAARRKLGNLTRIREEIHDMNTHRLARSPWQDLRYARARCCAPTRLRRGRDRCRWRSASAPTPRSSSSSTRCACAACRWRDPARVVEVRIAGGNGGMGMTPAVRQLTRPHLGRAADPPAGVLDLFAWAPTFARVGDGELRPRAGLWSAATSSRLGVGRGAAASSRPPTMPRLPGHAASSSATTSGSASWAAASSAADASLLIDERAARDRRRDAARVLRPRCRRPLRRGAAALPPGRAPARRVRRRR